MPQHALFFDAETHTKTVQAVLFSVSYWAVISCTNTTLVFIRRVLLQPTGTESVREELKKAVLNSCG